MKSWRIAIRTFEHRQDSRLVPITNYQFIQATTRIDARRAMIARGYAGRIIAIEHTPKIGE